MLGHPKHDSEGSSLIFISLGHLNHPVSLHFGEQEIGRFGVREPVPVYLLSNFTYALVLDEDPLLFENFSDDLQVLHPHQR